MQCSKTFHTIGRVCVKISSSITQKLHKKASPAKKLFRPKECVFQKKFYPEKWVFPKHCVFIKKSVSPEIVSPLTTCFTWKTWLTRKKCLRECNIYVKIPNSLTSENFGKFLRWKSICSSFPFLLVRIYSFYYNPEKKF